MENSTLTVLKTFPGISDKLEYFDSRWLKINQGGPSEITEKRVKDLIEKNHPDFFSKFTLEQFKQELLEFTLKKRNTLKTLRDEKGWSEYQDETEFIKDMNSRFKLFEVTASNAVVVLSGKSKLFERLKVLVGKYIRDTGDKELKPGNISDHLEVIVDDMALNRKNELKNKIKYDASLGDPFEELMNAMRITEHRELHKNALKHYVWQIKRKLWGYEPGYHFMLVLFTNKQAFGKSVFLRRFHGALSEIFACISGDRIRDNFGATLFENYYAACIDEMAQLNSADIHMLKEFVTRKSSVSRQMHSQINRVNAQNTTLCGTTNRPVNQVIYDPSGMRRWWQINLDVKNHDSMDFEKLEQWHEEEFIKFWKSVDETNSSGFYGKNLPLYDEMLNYQDSFKAVSPVQQFVEEMGYSHDYLKNGNDQVPKEEIDMDKVWSSWVGWCKATRNNPYTFQSFKNNLQELGFDMKLHRPINKTTGQRGRMLFLVIDRHSQVGEL